MMRALSLVLTLATAPLFAEDFADQLPRIPATEPSQTLQHFSVADGFKLELVASEPLLSSPVAIEWAGDGRMFVCEMRGYSEDQQDKISSIGLLQDSDGDGVYDRRSDYATGLSWPTAIFPFNGGLFVGDAPDLLYLKDTDGDDVADIKTVVLTGFGTSNVQGLLNSFRWGLDNRIHIACSSVGGKLRRPDQPPSAAIDIRGRDIALDPLTYEFELTSGAAQHGMCFDDWGRKYVSSNSDHIQQVMYEDRYIARNRFFSSPGARVSIASDGPQAEVFRTSPVEPWRIVRTRLRVAGKVPGPVEGGGRAAGYFTGATGVTIYRGDAWPQEWKGTAIIGDVGSNLIHRKRIDTGGLEHVAKRIDFGEEFVSSSDIWFRPAQFANAPDGSLHVVDVCREVIEHPKSLPPDIKRHLDLTAGRDRGRIYRIVPTETKHRQTPNLRVATTEQLVALLGHKNAWHRETASRLLFQRKASDAIAPLRRLVANSPRPLARLHALCLLDGLGGLDTTTLLAGLDDSHTQIRRHAIRLAEPFTSDQRIAAAYKSLVEDDSVDVRYQLAFSAGEIANRPDRIAVLGRLVGRDSANRWMQTAIQSSLTNDAGEMFAMIAGGREHDSLASYQFLERLAGQILAQRDVEQTRQAVLVLESIPSANASMMLPVLGKFANARKRGNPILAKLDRNGELTSLDQAITDRVAAMMAAASDEDQSAATRAEAALSLTYGEYGQVGSMLIGLLDSQHPNRVQRAALQSLATFDNDEVAEAMIKVWNGLSPQLQEVATEAMFARPSRTLRLFDAVDRGKISMSSLPLARLKMATSSGNKDVQKRASQYLSQQDVGARSKLIAKYQPALDQRGNVDRGKQLFAKHCSQCHKIGGVGHEIGPSLATIKARGRETILVNVLDPNREVNPQFLNYIALTVDGQSITGMIAAESASSITLKRAENESDTLLRVDLEAIKNTGMSIMPEGLEKVLDQQAMADLIEYLMQVQS